MLDYGIDLFAKFHACEEEIPGEWPSWRTKLVEKTQVLIDTGNARKALVFRINDHTDFTVNAMTYCAIEYEHDHKPSELHMRPYFRREFAWPIGKALAEKRIKLAYPENADWMAVRHLGIQEKL